MVVDFPVENYFGNQIVLGYCGALRCRFDELEGVLSRREVPRFLPPRDTALYPADSAAIATLFQ
jgi:hypothetical protein